MRTFLKAWTNIFLVIMGLALQAEASNKFLTYQGRITELNGTPLEYEFTQFRFEITDPSGTCVLYRETSATKDMRNSKGVFDVAIGAGSVDANTPAGNNVESVFKNMTAFNCIGGGTFNAGNGDSRKLRVSFRDSAGWRLLTQDQEIRGVPFASFAQSAASANRLGTASESDFLKISNIPTCAAGTFLRHVAPTGTLICEGVGSFSGADISGNIPGNSAGFTGALAGDVTGTQAATSVDRIKGLPVNAAAAADGKVLKYQSGSLVFADDEAGMATIADGSVTDAKIDSITSAGKVSGSAITSGTISGSTVINTSGLIQTNNGIRLYSGSSFVELKASSSPSGDYSLRFPAAAGSNGQVLKVDASGNLYWATDDLGGGGSVTSVSSGNLYLTVTNSSTTPTITANVGTTANTLAAGDDSRFTDARTPTGTAGGDLSGTYPNPGIAAIRGNAVTPGTIPGADVGKVYRWNGASLAPAFLTFGDLRTAGGAQQLAATCAANEKIQWSVITDTFTCQTIGNLNATAITAGTIDSARLPTSVKYWEAATGGINYSGGNVGIENSSPLVRLHLGSDSDALVDGATPFYLTRSTSYPTNGLEISGLAYVSEGLTSSTTIWPPQGSISFLSTQDHNATQKGTAISFTTTPNNSTTRQQRMVIDQNGNVGIGSSVPASKLEVAGTIHSTSGGIKFPDGTTQTTAYSASGASSGIVLHGSGRRYFDGSYATSCLSYQNGTGLYSYAGSIGDGVYTIDPDGAGATAPFDVWCAMAQGGWTYLPIEKIRIGRNFNNTTNALSMEPESAFTNSKVTLHSTVAGSSGSNWHGGCVIVDTGGIAHTDVDLLWDSAYLYGSAEGISLGVSANLLTFQNTQYNRIVPADVTYVGTTTFVDARTDTTSGLSLNTGIFNAEFRTIGFGKYSLKTQGRRYVYVCTASYGAGHYHSTGFKLRVK